MINMVNKVCKMEVLQVVVVLIYSICLNVNNHQAHEKGKQD